MSAYEDHEPASGTHSAGSKHVADAGKPKTKPTAGPDQDDRSPAPDGYTDPGSPKKAPFDMKARIVGYTIIDASTIEILIGRGRDHGVENGLHGSFDRLVRGQPPVEFTCDNTTNTTSKAKIPFKTIGLDELGHVTVVVINPSSGGKH